MSKEWELVRERFRAEAPAGCKKEQLLKALRANTGVPDAFDIDRSPGSFTGKHASFLNAFSMTQMFSVYCEMHMPPREE